ncbi:MAG TPA: hypothetical protein VGJ05_14760 [Fimbriiglobus sp.]|jgi:hypothetical protein
MPESNGTPLRFSVGLTGLAREQLRLVGRQGIYNGTIEAVRDAYRQIFSRLQNNPRELGEPLYELRKMKVQVRRVGLNPLYVEFGVHNQNPIVIIRHIGWLALPETE